jgi:hypothetical protein
MQGLADIAHHVIGFHATQESRVQSELDTSEAHDPVSDTVSPAYRPFPSFNLGIF